MAKYLTMSEEVVQWN